LSMACVSAENNSDTVGLLMVPTPVLVLPGDTVTAWR
jgi:hypothetical protein